MKTPRAFLAVLFALAASVARAGEATPPQFELFIPQSNSGMFDFSRPQRGSDWTILRIERDPLNLPILTLTPSGTGKGDAITLVNSYDEYFIVPSRGIALGGNLETVLSISKDPYPGAMNGEPIRLLGPGGQPTGPQLWLPSRRPDDIRRQIDVWPRIAADNTRVEQRPLIILPRRDTQTDNFGLGGAPQWLNLPGQKPRDLLSPLLGGSDARSLLLGLNDAPPPTYYTALSNYKYDRRRKKLIGPLGEKSVSEMIVPVPAFMLTPPAVPEDIPFPGLTLVDSKGKRVDPKKGAQPPKEDTRRDFKKPAWAGNWKDKITALKNWHAVETTRSVLPGLPATMPFYCYHEVTDGHEHISGHLHDTNDIVECVDWVIPPGSKPQKEGDKEYVTRHYRNVLDVVFKNGEPRTVEKNGISIPLKDKPLSSAAIEGKKWLKVTAVPAAPVEETSVALIAEETRWLTKGQKDNYEGRRKNAKDAAARKAVDAEFRALVEAQIRPEAAAAYKAAHAAPLAEAAAKIKAAIGSVEMWGGNDVKAIVAPFQEKADAATAKLLEIQLSKEEWEALRKKPDDLRAYTTSRLSANGASGDGTAFDANYLDPVTLHLGAEAARKAAGAKPPVAPGGEDQLIPLLTDDEKKLLTPSELKVYQGIYDSAPAPKEKDKSLQAEAKRLRDLIASEGRGKPPAYKAPTTIDEFNKLPEWQKKKFCDDLVASTANLGADTRGVELGGGSSGDAKSQLLATDANSAANGGTAQPASSSAPAWAADACKPYNAPPVANNPGGGRPNIGGGVVPTPGHGVDVENKEKEKSKWLTQDLVLSAAKGAMVGLLIGSLFGPVGLIAGPLIGGAAFYGIAKITGG